MHTRVALAGLVISIGLVLALGALPMSPAVAQGGGGPAPQPQPPKDPNQALAMRFFDEAISWVGDGKPAIHAVTDFYADLHDVQISVEQNHHEGFLRVWFKSPDKYRWELRPQSAMRGMTTKILDGDRLWLVDPGNRVRRMHGTPGGARAIAQLKEDRGRLSDLAKFLTLRGLKGPGVSFHFEGQKAGSGDFAGQWIKVRRKLKGGADITFHLAYEKDAQNRPLRATWPGVVTVVGDPSRNEPTEYYLLQNWKRGPQFRYPSKITGFTKAGPGAQLTKFFLAFPADIRINTNLSPATFAEPK